VKTLGKSGALVDAMTLSLAMQKLNHAADNGEFSATLRPLECHALLDRLDYLEGEVDYWKYRADE
jgi:hypothetical protein